MTDELDVICADQSLRLFWMTEHYVLKDPQHVDYKKLKSITEKLNTLEVCNIILIKLVNDRLYARS